MTPETTTPAEIILTTLNAKYHHAAFGLRYLYANLGELQARARILEFTIAQNPRDIAEALLAHAPRVIGFGVYIWNTDQIRDTVSIIKRVSPETTIVLGGPEVSYETEGQTLYRLADYVIKGEADFLFRDFCRSILERGVGPSTKIIEGPLPDIDLIASPYPYYTDEDVKQRYIYVEASRGCPYKCEYCLSSLDKSVRNAGIDHFLAEMQTLIDRGARQFKFIDRTFNLSIAISSRILQFFLERMELGLFLHFEMVPDRLPTELRDLIRQFPAGALQFEIGIQTWNPEVAKLVSRRQDYAKVTENLRFLVAETGVHIHADLIVGLPAESIESFGIGFDALAALAPHEIQVGILKRLKGTPIIRHDALWKMRYQEHPPFQILQTSVMDFQTLQSMNRFAYFWNLIANSGNFTGTLELFKTIAAARSDKSLFWLFHEFSIFLHKRHPQGHGVALVNLLESTWLYLTEHLHQGRDTAKNVLLRDYNSHKNRDIPRFLKDAESTAKLSAPTGAAPLMAASAAQGNLPRRQQRHQSHSREATATAPGSC